MGIFELAKEISTVALLISENNTKFAFQLLSKIVKKLDVNDDDYANITVNYHNPLVSDYDFVAACSRILYHLAVAFISDSKVSLNNAKVEIINLYNELAKAL